MKGSPACKAGIKTGDIITGINTLPVLSANELMHYIMQSLPGSEVNLKVIRNSRAISIQATLASVSINAQEPGRTNFVSQANTNRVDSLQDLISGLEKELDSLQKQVHQSR